jgi:predicted transcriptional regulator of viral defense system
MAAGDQTRDSRREEVLELIRQQGGMVRTSEALRTGVPRRILYALYQAGLLEQVSRGLYRLAELPPLEAPDLATVARRVPDGVICLISALAFHELTTQVPHVVHVAVRKGHALPKLDFPQLAVYQFSCESFSAGIGEHEIDGTKVRMYVPEKTIADCFKFRHRLGADVALEGLKGYMARGHPDVEGLLDYARICRVEKTMRPYLEALL